MKRTRLYLLIFWLLFFLLLLWPRVLPPPLSVLARARATVLVSIHSGQSRTVAFKDIDGGAVVLWVHENGELNYKMISTCSLTSYEEYQECQFQSEGAVARVLNKGGGESINMYGRPVSQLYDHTGRPYMFITIPEPPNERILNRVLELVGNTCQPKRCYDVEGNP